MKNRPNPVQGQEFPFINLNADSLFGDPGMILVNSGNRDHFIHNGTK